VGGREEGSEGGEFVEEVGRGEGAVQEGERAGREVGAFDLRKGSRE